MRKSAEVAPINTISLLFLIARMAAMKNVLSPISETRIIEIDSPKIKELAMHELCKNEKWVF